ncbi:unnamed protein product [Rotaria sordida]|uniref:GOST seven transmembrane domain-containing protein n=1 Tax=Rotaria sordida TaxID=392033 RepID=A0A818JEI0_9BILA|nr:unnamed protein product [Rotaria sordida]CAF0913958.1 unnamed protein product [Rotaria sordida]CAF3538110.1 unnamed protein product [Rotaria sordida]CAF3547323.1 unnamed protein product [Rotaria sordida]
MVTYSSATLVDGIVTISWDQNEQVPIIDRFLTSDTQIQLKILCRESSLNTSVTRELIKKKLYKLNEKVTDTNIIIRGRIGRVVGCLPMQSDPFISTTQEDKNTEKKLLQIYYDLMWKEMEQMTFTAKQSDCDYSGTHLVIEQYSDIKKPEISPQQAIKLRSQQVNINKNKRNRRATNDISSPLANSVRLSTGTLLTWADGFYLIEIYRPEIIGSYSSELDIDVIVSMKNRHNGYITADEYPALVFYGVMCAIYALFAILWFVWCAFYWKELLKIQFCIGGVILIGMIEKSAFLVEYDTLNRNGYKVHYAIVTAEIFSCLKRTLSRMLVIIVAVGYGIVKPRLGPLKQKVIAIGIIYFGIGTTEAILRINTKHDETNNKILISRIPLAVIDALIYYWIFTSLITTTRTLRLRKNLLKLNVYRHFTNTVLFAIIASILFIIWSLKSHFFTTCITNWREFWVDDAFWHILFSIILLVIMFLFRPSNNNQRYAFVPLLDHSDNDDNDDNEFDGDEEKGESTLFDSITMRRVSNTGNGGLFKTKKQQQTFLNREANVSGSGVGGSSGNGTVEDALSWVEDNIPTSIADQALQALDSEDEIINAKLERSKMQ